MISESKGFIFVHIPKTAGNSIQTVLRPYSDDEFTTPEHFYDGVERFEISNKKYPKLHKHSGISDYRRALGHAGVSRMTVLTCVRNPWDRAISFYFSPLREVAVWDRGAFVRSLDEIPTMVSFLAYRRRFRRCIRHPDFVLRFETLASEFERLCSALRIPHVPLPTRNRAEKGDYRSYYDDDLAALVGERYKEDTEYFGYSFER